MSGEFGLKPLKVSQRPSDSSHRKIGTTAIPDNTETCSLTPNSEGGGRRRNSGAPMSPSAGISTGHESRPIQDVAEQQGVQAGHDAGSEQERLIADRDERLAHRDQRGESVPVLPRPGAWPRRP